MKSIKFLGICLLFALTSCASSSWVGGMSDPLPSWNDVVSKQRIIGFVNDVTRSDGPDFVVPSKRVAVFDNDGTLWAEQPLYFQLAFMLDRVRAMAPEHAEWKRKEPFKSAIAGDMKGVMKSGKAGLVQLLAAAHSGMSTEEFSKLVEVWVEEARHPSSGKRYTEMIYQPMLEVIRYLEKNEFKVFIVSGGGLEFMRPWSERVYGIPPERVVGSHLELEYKVVDGVPTLIKLPKIALLDDKEGKPVAINRFIGRRPLAAFGNSDGDFQMLEYTTAGQGKRLGVIVHHTDAEREWAYDRDSHIGQLERGLDEADERGWLLVDMAEDWNTIFPE